MGYIMGTRSPPCIAIDTTTIIPDPLPENDYTDDGCILINIVAKVISFSYDFSHGAFSTQYNSTFNASMKNISYYSTIMLYMYKLATSH